MLHCTVALPWQVQSRRIASRKQERHYNLFRHVKAGRLHVIQRFVSEDAVTIHSLRDANGKTVLYYAVRHNHLDLVRHLRSVAGFDVHQEFGRGYLVTCCAAQQEEVSVDMLRLLVEECGADVNRAESSTGWTALHRACVSGSVAKARYLLSVKGIACVRSKRGLYPWNVATDATLALVSDDTIVLMESCVRDCDLPARTVVGDV